MKNLVKKIMSVNNIFSITRHTLSDLQLLLHSFLRWQYISVVTTGSVLLVFLSIAGCTADQNPFQSIDISLDSDWYFLRKDIPEAKNPGYDNRNWRLLNLPHDWSIEGKYDRHNTPQNAWLPIGVGWYRKEININKAWLQKTIFIHFDGVYMNSTVYVNGKKAGTRPYGFISFQYDITDIVKPGKNIVAVKVDDTPPPTARFYHGGGIYGHVKLRILPRLQINPLGGVFVYTAEANKDRATLNTVTEVINRTGKESVIRVNQEIQDRQDNTITGHISRKIHIAPGDTVSVPMQLLVKMPRLWSPETPYLYHLVTVVMQDGQVTDRTVNHFGIRTIRFDPQTGFWLNDKNIKLQGVCEHLEMSPFGLALPDTMWKRRILLLKKMGCNAIRTAHNPFPPIFYDLCDRMGMMVMDEVFDGWHRKGANDYGGRFFKEWWRIDVATWVQRDRNHPSVILWSIGNETGRQDIHNITGEIHKYDAGTRPVTGGSVFYGVDVSGFNGLGGKPGVLEQFHKDHPDRPVVLTEVPHTIQTRGFYRVPTWWRDPGNPVHEFKPYGTSQIFFDGLPRYRSSYDNCGVRINARTSWKRTQNTPWISGEFRWTGFECLGEAQFMGVEFPKRTYNSGVIDLAGFPKDLYYFYQSQWTKKPMVHILPHWTHPALKKGTVIPVVVYSNCEVVELLLNGTSLGRKTPGELLDFVWDVPYDPGTLKAVGYITGKVVAAETLHTAGPPVRLTLSNDHGPLVPGKNDLTSVTISVVDKNGNFVPWVQNRVDFSMEGPVELIGFENGNPIDSTRNKDLYRYLFYGVARGFFRDVEGNGPVRVTAAAILGDTLFQEKTQIAIDVCDIGLMNPLEKARYSIYFTTDGSVPMKGKNRYTKPFVIDKTTTVKASVYKEDRLFMTLETVFEKGTDHRFHDPRLKVSS